MTQQQQYPQQMTPLQLSENMGIALTTLKARFERLRDKNMIKGSWSKKEPLSEEQLILLTKGAMQDETPTPSVSESKNEQQQQQRIEAERQQQRQLEEQQRLEQQQLQRQQRIEIEQQRQVEKETQTKLDAMSELIATIEQQREKEQQQQQATDYDKRPLAAFCFSLFVVNLIVVLPNVSDMAWYMQIGGIMVCSFAPFLEYRYSHILIEIWAKEKIQRQGVLRYFYTEGLAVLLLIPAMIFQSHDVYRLSELVLKPEGYFESALPIFLAFSYQLFGLMQTLHLPKKQG